MQGENKIRNELYSKVEKIQTLEQFEKEINTSSIDVTFKKILLNY